MKRILLLLIGWMISHAADAQLAAMTKAVNDGNTRGYIASLFQKTEKPSMSNISMATRPIPCMIAALL